MQLSLRFCLPVIGMLLAASTAVAVERSSIVEQHGCFERFPTYDTWMEYLWQKNNVFGYFVLHRRYPELEFERHQPRTPVLACVSRSPSLEPARSGSDKNAAGGA